MTRFLDGPAEGTTLLLARAPFFLRAVQDRAGIWDALDQLADEPREHERVAVYQQVSEPRRVHLQRSVKGRRVCGWYEGAEYRLAPNPPSDAIARSRLDWQTWAATEGPKRCGGLSVPDKGD